MPVVAPPVPAILFQRETLETCREDALPLLEAHWQEVAHFKDIPLDPDWPLYEALEQIGSLRIFTMRADEALVGYAVFMLRRNAHYRGSFQGVQDILFVAPEYRTVTGGRFIPWCDAQLKEDGVEVVYHHVKCAIDFGPLLKVIGYEQVETVWAKRLR